LWTQAARLLAVAPGLESSMELMLESVSNWGHGLLAGESSRVWWRDLRDHGAHRCPSNCRQAGQAASISPLTQLISERSTPELQYLETRWASLVSYGLTVRALNDFLPVDEELNISTVRRTTLEVARRCEAELRPEQSMFIHGCQAEWDELPRPDLPLTVGLDGGYVHSSQQRSRKDGWFEVIAGKSMPADGPAKCFGFVPTCNPKPKRRLFEVLKSQGMAMNQQGHLPDRRRRGCSGPAALFESPV
jgi:hypothetical protein